METGNPRQVAALSVVAVGALGFLLLRLGGRSAPPPAAAVAAAVRPPAPAPAVGPLVLVKDPFSHRLLAPAKPAVAEPAVVGPSAQKPTGGRPWPSLAGTLPSAGPSFGPLAVAEVASGAPKAVPTEAPKSVAPTTIGLEAIASSSDTVAFLTVGGAESQPYRPGERVSGSIRLRRVGDGAVVLSGPKGRVTLDVGEKASL